MIWQPGSMAGLRSYLVQGARSGDLVEDGQMIAYGTVEGRTAAILEFAAFCVHRSKRWLSALPS